VTSAGFSDAARARAADLLLDFLAVATRGAQTDAARTARAAARSALEQPGPCVVLGTDSSCHGHTAAFLNGLAGHSIELDDTYEPGSLHPGVVVWPALLAAAGSRPDTSWGDLLDAAAAGYDAACLTGELAGPANLYERAFHPTGVCGVLGAAAAVCRLDGADEETVLHGFGIAASASSGLMAFLDDGSWTKPFHAGHAASSGLQAAELALAGYRGPLAVLESEHGFTRAFGDPGADRVVTADTPTVERTSVKRYPTCRYTHSSIDLLIELQEQHDVPLEEIVEVRCAIPGAGMALVAEPAAEKQRIRSTVDAQFSMPFTAAAALADRAVELRHIESPPDIPAAIEGLMPKVSSHRDESVEAGFPAHWAGLVEVQTRDGLLRAEQADCVGSPARPLDREALLEKAAALVGDEAAGELDRRVAPDHPGGVFELSSRSAGSTL
jgi:2-methylcitrate dehydratase PrpD